MIFVWILAGLVAVIAILLLVGAMQPAEVAVRREATIAAPPASVFAEVDDFHRWRAWSPWEAMDPNLERTYSGAASGKGAAYAWKGNKQVGEGRMTILESTPGELISIRLEFLKPFKATNKAEFTFRPEGAGTRVAWTMTCKKNLMMKTMCMFMSMDKMVGKDFEKGLASMKQLAEGKG